VYTPRALRLAHATHRSAGEVTLPFPCSLDAALDVDALDATGWEYVEHSFLDNPRFLATADATDAASNAASRLTLQLCAASTGAFGAAGAEAGVAAADDALPACGDAAAVADSAAGGVVQLPAGATVAATAAALAKHAGVRVLQLDVWGPGLVAGFNAAAEADAFNARFAKLARFKPPPLQAAPLVA
jgi:hypothetical protein